MSYLWLWVVGAVYGPQPVLHRAPNHRPARIGAATALLAASPHHLIVRKRLAALRAHVADEGAGLARAQMQRGIAQHEVGADAAHVRAVEQRRDVIGRRVAASQLKTVRNGLQADVTAALASVDGTLHVGASRLGHVRLL